MTKSSNNKRGGSRRKQTPSVDSEFVNSHKLTGSTTTMVKSDLVSRPQNFNIVSRPPRNFFTQTFWAQLSSADTVLVSSISAIVEANVSPSASGFPGAAAYLATFDQYCLYSVVMTVSYMQENSAVTSSVQNVILHTALDYDNIANIGLASLQGYSTYSETQLAPNTSLVRFCKPCLQTSQYNTSNSAVASGIQRAWIDAAFNAIPWFGFRLITGITLVSTVSMNVSFTAIFGFRNGI